MSVGINMSVPSLVCSEAWGTEPTFTWLHERAAITAVVGHVSADGKTLVASHAALCGHFTCVVSNKMGYSSATYTAGTLSAAVRLKSFTRARAVACQHSEATARLKG